MRRVEVSLQLNDDVAAPTLAVVATVDGGQPIVANDVPVAQWRAVLDAASVAAGTDLLGELADPIAQVLERLRADWQRDHDANTAREEMIAQLEPLVTPSTSTG